jgi:hypothetical protein
MKKLLLMTALAGMISATGCENESKESKESEKKEVVPNPALEEFSKLEWMLGTWSATFPDQSKLTESWTRVNDTTFSGETHLVAGKDTFFADKPGIVWKDGALHYMANVAGQNEGKTIYFKAVSGKDGEQVFENKQHDYPQKITYMHKSDTTLFARLEGMEKGKPKTEEFEMYKRP